MMERPKATRREGSCPSLKPVKKVILDDESNEAHHRMTRINVMSGLMWK